MNRTLEQRYAVKFCVRLGKTATETYTMIKDAFGNNSMGRSSIFEWHKLFKEGREQVFAVGSLRTRSVERADETEFSATSKLPKKRQRVAGSEAAEQPSKPGSPKSALETLKVHRKELEAFLMDETNNIELSSVQFILGKWSELESGLAQNYLETEILKTRMTALEEKVNLFTSVRPVPHAETNKSYAAMASKTAVQARPQISQGPKVRALPDLSKVSNIIGEPMWVVEEREQCVSDYPTQHAIDHKAPMHIRASVHLRHPGLAGWESTSVGVRKNHELAVFQRLDKEEGAGQPPFSSRPQGLRATAVVSGTGKVIPRYPKPLVLQANCAEPHTVNPDAATTH
ncbi:Putative uncharacterized protein FLJ37770 [Habropoda laboriosa]|uniref:Mos1 transposase HTH domain-containing protein n=1 Tax=Habropoda laboriosa TaxID=597456 RepID=A0A0L7QJ78_9HYME|nr:Putative uncharacterized protein FLJ37770 [Habropoda laboriosa]